MPNPIDGTSPTIAAPHARRTLTFRRNALNYASNANVEQLASFQPPLKTAQLLAAVIFLYTVFYFIDTDYSMAQPADTTVEPHECVSSLSTSEFPTEKISCGIQLTKPKRPLYRIFIRETNSV